jgi:hypothetical protein
MNKLMGFIGPKVRLVIFLTLPRYSAEEKSWMPNQVRHDARGPFWGFAQAELFKPAPMGQRPSPSL